MWGFLHSFGEVLGVWPASLAELLGALAAGSASRLTTELHIGLLRLLQVHSLATRFTYVTRNSANQTTLAANSITGGLLCALALSTDALLVDSYETCRLAIYSVAQRALKVVQLRMKRGRIHDSYCYRRTWRRRT